MTESGANVGIRGRQHGFALLIVLWTVGFLALLGTQIVAAGRSDTQLADNLNQEAILSAAADGAVANVAFQMLAARNAAFQADGIQREILIGRTKVLVRVENEADRVNINTASGVLLNALMVEVGAPATQAGQLAAAILDWRTSGATARPGGAKIAEYRAAGRPYGPSGTPFESVAELADVLGMTPDLYNRLLPHITILTEADPDFTSRDPVVIRALTDAAGVADDTTTGAPQGGDELLRINVTAIGKGAARYAMVAVASANFQATSPHVKVLLRERSRDPVRNTQRLALSGG